MLIIIIDTFSSIYCEGISQLFQVQILLQCLKIACDIILLYIWFWLSWLKSVEARKNPISDGTNMKLILQV